MSTLSVPRYGDHGRLLPVFLLWSRLLERRAGRLGRRRLCQSFLPAMRSATAWYSFGLLASSCCSPSRCRSLVSGAARHEEGTPPSSREPQNWGQNTQIQARGEIGDPGGKSEGR